MHFKILETPELEYKKYAMIGMVPVFAAFYLDEKDEGYKLTKVPVLPKEGYQGKVDKMGMAVDKEDYQKWYSSLPTQLVNNPFCIHQIKFEPNVREDEILFCFEWALVLTHINYLADDLNCKKGLGQKVNQDIGYLKRITLYKNTLAARVNEINSTVAKSISLNSIDFKTVQNAELYSVK
jgi:hypothetical protein